MTRCVKRFFVLLCLLLALPATAHEVRPAYLEIHEDPAGEMSILWKEPVVGDRTIAIRPQLSSGWLDENPTAVSVTDTALVHRWQLSAPHVPLAGQVIEIHGLDFTLTDVLVSIRYADGSEISQVINPANPRFEIPASGTASLPVRRYLWLGVTHIWGGADHLLYVFGLVMLVAAVRPLFWTLTSFTLAHSITLGLTTLDLVRLPTAPVEAVIALSIVALAVELHRQARGESGLASQRPWLIAFPFGLLHGFGFAGALQEVGLTEENIPMVLLLFNLGIEAGQIAFVLAVLAVARLVRAIRPIELSRVRNAGAYALGTIASYWFIGRILPA